MERLQGLVEKLEVERAAVGCRAGQADGEDGGGEVALGGVGGLGAVEQAADAGAQGGERVGLGRRRGGGKSFVRFGCAGSAGTKSFVQFAGAAATGRIRPAFLALRWARKARCARWVAMPAAEA